jgi:hypothetical protein
LIDRRLRFWQCETTQAGCNLGQVIRLPEKQEMTHFAFAQVEVLRPYDSSNQQQMIAQMPYLFSIRTGLPKKLCYVEKELQSVSDFCFPITTFVRGMRSLYLL